MKKRNQNAYSSEERGEEVYSKGRGVKVNVGRVVKPRTKKCIGRDR